MVLLTACDSQAPSPAPERTTAAIDGEEVAIEASEPTPAPSAPADPAATKALDPEAEGTPAPEPTLFNLPHVPADDVAEDRAALTAIPARFLGQWDAPEGPCSPESDMFMTIRPGTITFYESQGKVTAVRRGRPGIVVTLAMEGEGESWTSEYAMTLGQGREELATREVSQSGTGTIRHRCPAERAATGS
ncbi:MAG: hypothetical protein CL808_03585 [Citromicrobium sp.]|nr:hypothetical protein [Citromicrobium sp.]